jgi:uncharacterized membrane protein SpoIIM required for sporulation
MIEIILGLLLLAGGGTLSLGVLGAVLPLGGLEILVGMLLAALGSILLSHGLFRRVRDGYDGNSYAMRRHGVMFVALLSAAVLIVAGVAVFGQFTVSGLAIGYHVVAEIIPFVLFVLFGVFKRKQDAIEQGGLYDLR